MDLDLMETSVLWNKILVPSTRKPSKLTSFNGKNFWSLQFHKIEIRLYFKFQFVQIQAFKTTQNSTSKQQFYVSSKKTNNEFPQTIPVNQRKRNKQAHANSRQTSVSKGKRRQPSFAADNNQPQMVANLPAQIKNDQILISRKLAAKIRVNILGVGKGEEWARANENVGKEF
jgi:hypothetical protein